VAAVPVASQIIIIIIIIIITIMLNLSRIITSPCRPDRLWRPPNLLYNGYRELFPGVRRLGREADHSPPTSVEVKNMWIYISTPPHAFMA
jgi:hypothetical protein